MTLGDGVSGPFSEYSNNGLLTPSPWVIYTVWAAVLYSITPNLRAAKLISPTKKLYDCCDYCIIYSVKDLIISFVNRFVSIRRTELCFAQSVVHR